jgi:hypothetical protein
MYTVGIIISKKAGFGGRKIRWAAYPASAMNQVWVEREAAQSGR